MKEGRKEGITMSFSGKSVSQAIDQYLHDRFSQKGFLKDKITVSLS
jgi:hypothetical protein